MCGIAGGLHLRQDQLDSMLEALRHRGPDGRASFDAPPFSFGMTRLAILDIEHGQQPFTSKDGRVTTVCNGEIYNWQELRVELEKSGHHFKTRCDCEIIPAAWIEWGPDMLERFNGMFAIALHDRDTDSLFLARDRCGQKPLYLTTSGPFLFASEIKALSAAAVALEPNPMELSNWLSLRYVSEPATMFRNIETLPAAHWMEIQADGTRKTERYWVPPSRGRQTSADRIQTVDQLDRLARSSVELALQSDVPVATYLSAGVDSSLLAHYIQDLGAEVTSVSIGFGVGSDETAEASRFARSLGLDHHPTQLTPESLQDLPRVISQMERPLGDALILAFDKLASHTSKLGCKVALGGEGPDEHFAGYSFHKAYLTAARIGKLGRNLASTFLENCPTSLLNKLSQFPADLGPEGREKAMLYLDRFDILTPTEQIHSLRTLFSHEDIKAMLHPDLLAHQQQPGNNEKKPRRSQRLDFALRSQYDSWLPDWSLIRQDKNAMAHSLEYRAPFLDHRIIDFAFGLPDSFKIKGRQDKVIWRELAARHLPASVTQRPKQPFYLPLENPAWREPFIKMAHDVLGPDGYSCNGWLNPKAVIPLLTATHFLPLKQLAAIVILQIWLDAV
ncbi:MAG: asparagine synthase (glutamine-hydrolyzing) [Akkermansiaceae bacterium]|nr:asparagine synthase (glutamine-hydrolyzing) [Akkermansiaceae bacterium]